MSLIATTRFSADAARQLTDEVKADAAALWAKLLRLYEGGAHTMLGYASWAAYCAAEFDMGKSHAYRMLDAARVVDALPRSPNGERLSEGVARELAAVLRDDPEQLQEVWEELVERHGPRPTAKQVRARVEAFRFGRLSHAELMAELAGIPSARLDAMISEGHAICVWYGRRALSKAVEMGDLLIYQESVTPHGQWEAVQKTLVGSLRTASEFMRVALGFSADPGRIEAAGTIEEALGVIAMMELPTHEEYLARRVSSSAPSGHSPLSWGQ